MKHNTHCKLTGNYSLTARSRARLSLHTHSLCAYELQFDRDDDDDDDDADDDDSHNDGMNRRVRTRTNKKLNEYASIVMHYYESNIDAAAAVARVFAWHLLDLCIDFLILESS